MKKMNLKLLILTSLLTLMPMLIGLFLWKDLPDVIPSHFGFDGAADGFSSKAEVVFLMPLVMIAVHLFAVLLTSLDPKAKNVTVRMRTFIYWIVPVICSLVQLSIYGTVLGLIKNSTRLGILFIGILFIIIGNYLPKTKQNYTVGIKLPWTLDNEENWNKTHRLAGKLWVIGGLMILINEWLRWAVPQIFFGVLLLMIVVPIVYSYRLSQTE